MGKDVQEPPEDDMRPARILSALLAAMTAASGMVFAAGHPGFRLE